MQNHQTIKANSNAYTAQHCTWVTQTKLIQTEQVLEPWPGWNCFPCNFKTLGGNTFFSVEDQGGSDALMIIATNDTAAYLGGAEVDLDVTPNVASELRIPVGDITAGSFIAVVSEIVNGEPVELASDELVSGTLKKLNFTPTQSEVQLKLVNTSSGSGGLSLFTVDFAVLMPTAVNVLVRVCDESEDWRHGLNGIAKTNEIAGIGNHYTALFGEYDPRTGIRWNKDPKPNPSMSPYAMFGGNPILFSDLYLDSVSVSGLYEKDNKGNYKNQEAIKGFELFASTDKGRQYLLDHGQEGFKLQGVFVSDLSIEATEEGIASKNGVDVSFGLGSVGTGAGAFTSSTIVGGVRKSVGGRLKTRFVFPSISRGNSLWDPGVEQTMFNVGTVTHEVFLHGTLHERRFLRNYSSPFLKDADHSDKIFNTSYFAAHGLRTVQKAQIKLINGTNLKGVSNANLQLMLDIGRGANLREKYNLKSTQEVCDFKNGNK